MKKLIEIIADRMGYKLISYSELMRIDEDQSKLRSIKNAYDHINNPMVTNAKERLIELIELIRY